jgi:hypothetical protein
MFKWIYFHILFVTKLGLIVMQMISTAAVTSQNWGKGVARKRKSAELMV